MSAMSVIVAIVCFVVAAEGQTHFTHSNTHHPLRGYQRKSHSSSYGYLYDRSATLDDDSLDEWGSVHEPVDLVRGSKGAADDHREHTYNKGMTRDEGNMAFNTDNPSTGRPGGPGQFNVTATMAAKPSWSPGPNVVIDGNTDDQWNSGTCMHTTRQTDPWWKVDLGEDRTVSEVRIYNLGGHRRYKMEEIEVFVGDGQGGAGDKQCGESLKLKNQNNNIHLLVPTPMRHMVDTGGVLRVSCPQLPTAPIQPSSGPGQVRGGGLSGRFVTIKVKGTNKVLHLCEVQVIGSLLMAPAIDQGANQRYGLDQGGGIPIDPCSVDVRQQSEGVTRLCHD